MDAGRYIRVLKRRMDDIRVLKRQMDDIRIVKTDGLCLLETITYI